MLLENFLSSGPSESLADTKQAVNKALTDSNKSLAGGVAEFKNALSSSIEIRNKSNTNQADRANNKSDTLTNTAKWDKNNTATDVINSEFDKPEELINIGSILENSEVKSYVNDRQDLSAPSGNNMLTDGKQLPDNLDVQKSSKVTQPESLANSIVTIDDSESRNLEGKTIEGKTIEGKTIEGKAIEGKTVEGKTIEGKTVEGKTVEGKTVEGKTIEGKTVEGKTVEGKTVEGKTVEGKTVEGKTVEGKTVEGKTVEGKTVEGKTIEGKTVEGKTVDTDKNINSSKMEYSQSSVPAKVLVEPTEFPAATKIKSIDAEKAGSNAAIPVENKVVITTTSDIKLKTALFATQEEIKDASRTIQIKSRVLTPEAQKTNNKFVELTQSREVNNPTKQFISSESDLTKVDLLTQNIYQNKKLDSSTVAESVKLDLLNQNEDDGFKLKINAVSEQLMKQVRRDDNVSNLLTNVGPSTSLTAKIPEYIINEAITNPVQQIQSSQIVNRATEITLPVNLPTQIWNHKFAEHVSLLALKGATDAQIRLDPPELGPMVIRIHQNGSETQIQFQVNNPIARELVDSGMNKLREMLEQQGFANVDVDITEHRDDSQQTSEEQFIGHDIDEKLEELTTNSRVVTESNINNSLIDLFA